MWHGARQMHAPSRARPTPLSDARDMDDEIRARMRAERAAARQ
jgi:hypothetical protein